MEDVSQGGKTAWSPQAALQARMLATKPDALGLTNLVEEKNRLPQLSSDLPVARVRTHK